MAPNELWSAICAYQGSNGSMVISSDGLFWKPDGAVAAQHLVAWDAYKKHMISPASHPKALVRIDLESGASIKFEVVKATQPADAPTTPAAARGLAVQAKDVISAAKRAATGPRPAASAGVASAKGKAKAGAKSDGGMGWKSDELQKRALLERSRREVAKETAEQMRDRGKAVASEARRNLLEADPVLQEQHTQMVGEGLVSEEEFWGARRQMQLDKEAEQKARRPGLPSNILAEIEDPDGERAKKPLTLRAADIQFLFELYPNLRELYRRKVPEEMNEKQFWSQVLQSIRFHKERREVLAVDEYSTARSIPAMTVSAEELRRVDPTFDLASDFGDHARKPDAEEVYSHAFKETIDKYNRQACLLVKTRHQTSLSEHTEMPDLTDERQGQGFTRLRLRNMDAYREASAVELEDVEADGDDALGPPVDLSSYEPQLSNVAPPPEIARTVLQELTDRSQMLRSGETGPVPEAVASDLGKAYLEFSRVSEFLRHFHAFFQRLVTGQAAADGAEAEVRWKLERLVSKIESKAQELTKARRESWGAASTLGAMLLPFQKQLEHALDMYDTHQAVKGSGGWSTVSHQGPPAVSSAARAAEEGEDDEVTVVEVGGDVVLDDSGPRKRGRDEDDSG